jgi:hypothetical protein
MITIKCSWCPGPMYTFTLNDSMLVHDFLDSKMGKSVIGTRQRADAEITIQLKHGLFRTYVTGIEVLEDGDLVILKDKPVTLTHLYSNSNYSTIWTRFKTWLFEHILPRLPHV